jgi:recombinational DNA repair protein RecT
MSKASVIDDKGALVAGSHHEKFTAEACKKTVVNRVCKRIINSGDDKMYYSKFLEDENYMHAPVRHEAAAGDDDAAWERIDEATTSTPPILCDEDGVIIEAEPSTE